MDSVGESRKRREVRKEREGTGDKR